MGIKIGELSRLSGLSPGAIRFYEKAGIIRRPERSAGNYRLYDDEAIERLRFARHCRQQGLSLDETRLLLAYMDRPTANCAAIHEMVDRHIALLDEQIEQLGKLRARLVSCRESALCEGSAGCGIVNLLRGDDDCPFCEQLRERAEK